MIFAWHTSAGVLALASIACSSADDGVAGSAAGDDGATSGVGASGSGAGSGAAGGAGSGGHGNVACQDPDDAVEQGIHVAPNGTPDAAGTPDSPLDLATALSASSPAAPGNIVYLSGGVYPGTFTSELAGTEGSPITVRSLPGAWAVLDAAGSEEPTLSVAGSWTTFADFEVTSSSPPAPTSGGPSGNIGVNVNGVGTRLVRLVIHDNGGSGIGTWIPAESSETHGCIVYYNGRSSNFDHGIYAQNQTGEKRITDNVFFANYAYGIHAYGSDASFLQGFVIAGNTVFGSGSIGDNATNLLLGGGAPTVDNVVSENMVYAPPWQGGTNVRLGYGGEPHGLVAEDNYIVGGEPTLRFEGWTPEVILTGNTLAAGESYLVMLEPSGQEGALEVDGNSYFHAGTSAPFSNGGEEQDFDVWKASTGFDATSMLARGAPTGSKVFVRADPYEPGRAVVTVFNHGEAGTVAVDLAGVLEPGWAFEVRSVENYLAGPMVEGVYPGGTVDLPMTGHTTAAPIGVDPPASTAPAFAVFVVRRARCPAP